MVAWREEEREKVGRRLQRQSAPASRLFFALPPFLFTKRSKRDSLTPLTICLSLTDIFLFFFFLFLQSSSPTGTHGDGVEINYAAAM